MTIREIAKECGVSPATVSRAINGQAPVKAETKARIEKALEQAGYLPKTSRRGFMLKGHGLVGIMTPSLSHQFFRHVTLQIDNQIRKYGKAAIVIPFKGEIDTALIKRLPLDGVILLHEEISAQTVGELKSLGLAMVMCGALSLTKSFSSVHVDDLAAAYDGTTYLLKLGHREIGFVCDSQHSVSSGFQRIAGSRKAMEDYGVPFRDGLMASFGNKFDGGYRGAGILLKETPGITAIFAHSDESALGVVAALHDMGLAVPDDISVLGFDDIPLAGTCLPRLTCVHQPIEEIVAKSLEILTSSIERPESMEISSITLPHSIIERESCRKKI